MVDKKTGMDDCTFMEWSGQEKNQETEAELRAKNWAKNLVKNLNMKKSTERNLEMKEKSKNSLIKKLDGCDWTDSKRVSSVINHYIKFSKNYVDNREGSKELIQSFKNFLERASIIETRSMIKLISSFNAWKLEVTDNLYDSTIEVSPFDYLDKCEMNDELVYRVIMAGEYGKLKKIWVEKKVLNKSFKHFKNFLRKKLSDLDYALKWESSEFAELFWEVPILSVTWGVVAFIYDNFSECWDLDKDILCLLLDAGYEILEDDYKYFKWIDKKNFMEILNRQQLEEDE